MLLPFDVERVTYLAQVKRLGSAKDVRRTMNIVDVARKCLLNLHLQTAIYVYMKIRNAGLNFIQE
ncbi:hypothetical protein YA35_13680 [Klebsiella aerogenes]|nr:hypothetical protein YA35_13680 [Klebsiella aerogenes]